MRSRGQCSSIDRSEFGRHVTRHSVAITQYLAVSGIPVFSTGRELKAGILHPDDDYVENRFFLSHHRRVKGA